MKNKNILPYVIFGVPAIIGLYFVYKAIKNSKPKGQDAPPNYDPKQNSEVVVNDKGGATPKVAKLFPLKKGSKGGKVIELQRAMLGYDDTILGKYRDDGDFGTTTETALQTILGKKTADSQDDIDAIVNKTATKKADETATANKKVADDSRSILADKLIGIFKKNPSVYDFYAVHDTAVQTGKTTSDGRIVGTKNIVYKKGDKLAISSDSTLTKVNGFIQIRDSHNDNFFSISPYGFEVK